jgi:[calcium/calmodulin-dependent protein kinase] kinase
VQTVAEATVQTKRVKHEEVLTRLNEYRIGREIGRGAYGTVLKARKAKQAGRASEVAIKVAKRSALKRIRHGKGTALDSALREIAVMKKLSHPNVVQLIEVIDDPARDELYLVMELVTGGTLAEPIAKGQVSSEASLVRWMRDVVLGLEHLHHSGVVHRDLKPENLLWDKAAQRAKLADFGAAAICGEGRAGDYVRGTAGTPAFFAPEMCGDDSEMRADDSEMRADDRTRARGLYSGKVRPV